MLEQGRKPGPQIEGGHPESRRRPLSQRRTTALTVCVRHALQFAGVGVKWNKLMKSFRTSPFFDDCAHAVSC
jgi:hypothetical protein